MKVSCDSRQMKHTLRALTLACCILSGAMAETGVEPELVRQALRAYLAEHGEWPKDGRGPWLELVSVAGSPAELRQVMAQLAAEQFSPEGVIRALDCLVRAARTRETRPSANPGVTDPLLDPDYYTLGKLLRSPEPQIQASAAELVGEWRNENLADRLGELARANNGDVQRKALDALRKIGGHTALLFFEVLIRPDQPLKLRREVLVAIAEINLDAAMMQVGGVLTDIRDESQALETWRALLKMQGAAQALSIRLPQKLPREVIAAGIRAAKEMESAGEPLRKTLENWAIPLP
jgi:hypothetical protein